MGEVKDANVFLDLGIVGLHKIIFVKQVLGLRQVGSPETMLEGPETIIV